MTTHRGGSGNFAENRERAAEAGRKGGKNSGGNFKNDPQRAARAGEKGGRSSPKNRTHNPTLPPVETGG
jgi:general stress protein YciG